jgi:hypothetical protein
VSLSAKNYLEIENTFKNKDLSLAPPTGVISTKDY